MPDETARQLERGGNGAKWACSMLRKGAAATDVSLRADNHTLPLNTLLTCTTFHPTP